MKYVAVFLVVFLLCANPSLQIPQFNNCSSAVIASMQDGCSIVTCDGTNRVAVACAVYRCAGAVLEEKEQDNSKPFPECCGGPVCAES